MLYVTMSSGEEDGMDENEVRGAQDNDAMVVAGSTGIISLQITRKCHMGTPNTPLNPFCHRLYPQYPK